MWLRITQGALASTWKWHYQGCLAGGKDSMGPLPWRCFTNSTRPIRVKVTWQVNMPHVSVERHIMSGFFPQPAQSLPLWPRSSGKKSEALLSKAGECVTAADFQAMRHWNLTGLRGPPGPCGELLKSRSLCSLTGNILNKMIAFLGSSFRQWGQGGWKSTVGGWAEWQKSVWELWTSLWWSSSRCKAAWWESSRVEPEQGLPRRPH